MGLQHTEPGVGKGDKKGQERNGRMREAEKVEESGMRVGGRRQSIVGERRESAG